MTKYQVNFFDYETRATSAIDTVYADDSYTAEDYIEDCKQNADDDFCELLGRGSITLEKIDPEWYWTACRETGDKIESFRTREEAIEQIRKYEEDDKREGIYTPDFYDIVDDEFNSIDW